MSANQNDPQYKLRWPADLRDRIAQSAKTNNRSMNADIVARLESSFTNQGTPNADVRVINLPDRTRVVYGKLMNVLDLDYTQDLKRLSVSVELALYALQASSVRHRLSTFSKNVMVYQGNNHIDVVDDGRGSLNWLTVEDHLMPPLE